MNNPNENVSMALFCDFENVALGVRDTKFQKFDIRPVLERLLLKGSIVVKKAYCDWERYKEFKAPMHEANFELIEIPHVRQSGKNSADIRLVVDALDFCYTKSHVNTFVIISGDSDFSPLVSKLRENNKKVIGVGVKQSTSDLLIANCDEFIFYDDLAREGQRTAEARRDNRGAAAQRRSPDEERRRKEEQDARKTRAVEMVVETFEALMAERGDSGKIWASALKDALKRRKPDFNESYYGFRAFGNLLEEAQSRGFLEVGREEKSGTYVYRDGSGDASSDPSGDTHGATSADAAADAGEAPSTGGRNSRKSRGGRKTAGGRTAGSHGEGSERETDREETMTASASSAEVAEAWKQPDAPQQTEGGTVADVSQAPGQNDGGDSADGASPSRSGRKTDNGRQGRSGRRGRGSRTGDDGRQSGDSESGENAVQPRVPVEGQGPSEGKVSAEPQESSGRQAPSEQQAPARKREDAAPPAFTRPVPPPPQSALASGPPPVVNVADWTFVAPPAKTERERGGEAPDPFAGAPRSSAGGRSQAASEPAPATAPVAASTQSTAKPARGARKTTPKTQAKPESASAHTESATAPATETGTAAKPARKTAARKTAPRKTAKKADPA
ncbi:NYN domain-containing protein [Achromobacter sp.]|uniref:NYN domain-containing protein n=1 Tax=Achromobacter sp. TaxID=134375 RepID=UPI0028AF049F|nr:NYN domain-containing protein [Achromobacter sp.]